MSTVHQVVLILGLFGVPIALLVAGHRLRRGSQRRQRLFWGAVIGHCIAGTVALVASMIPAIGWAPSDTLRGAMGLWSLLVFPVAGALVAAVTIPPNSRP